MKINTLLYRMACQVKSTANLNNGITKSKKKEEENSLLD